MAKFKKYRVKMIVADDYNLTIKYKIQKYIPIFGWVQYCEPVKDMNWAHQTCMKLNAPHDDGENIYLTFETSEDAEWVVNCALAAIQQSYEEGSPRRLEMESEHKRLMEQIEKQK